MPKYDKVRLAFRLKTNVETKQRILNIISAHPRLLTFGISFGIATALAIGLAFATGGISGGDHMAYANTISQKIENNQ